MGPQPRILGRSIRSSTVRVVVSIASNQEKSAAQGAKKGPFCMGILVTLSLSLKKAPIGRKNIFVDKVVSEYP